MKKQLFITLPSAAVCQLEHRSLARDPAFFGQMAGAMGSCSILTQLRLHGKGQNDRECNNFEELISLVTNNGNITFFESIHII
jgi:hypothetical protein